MPIASLLWLKATLHLCKIVTLLFEGRRMSFPLSITGQIIVRNSPLRSHDEVMQRLNAALVAQSIDSISVSDNRFDFRPILKDGHDKPRPDGGFWLFGMLGHCVLKVNTAVDGYCVSYDLDCRGWLYLATALSAVTILFIIVMGIVAQPGHAWAWTFGLFIWFLFFGSGFASKAIEIRSWLRKNLMSVDLPRTKRLSAPPDLP